MSLIGVWQHLRTPAAMGSTGLFQRCAAVPFPVSGLYVPFRHEEQLSVSGELMSSEVEEVAVT